MIVDASDRKFYVMAAAQSADGERALREFDAALAAAQSKPPSSTYRPTRTTTSANWSAPSGPPQISGVGTGGAPAPSSVTGYQQQLIARGYDVGDNGADGIAGYQTRAAVMDFQRKNGLSVDGIVGPQTLAALNGKTAAEATQNVREVSKDFEQAEALHTYAAADAALLPGMNVTELLDDFDANYSNATDKLREASVEQYEAYENQTGHLAAYARADDDAGLPGNGAVGKVRDAALEEVVTSEITTNNQASARVDYATTALAESTTALAESSLSDLPADFDLSLLGRAGDVMTDELEALEADQAHSSEIYQTVAANNSVYQARQNTDIGTDIYAMTHYDHIVRAYQLGVSEATLEEIGRVSAEGMVDARLARPGNDNERNSQLTADIYDTGFLMLARNQTIYDASQPGAAGFDLAAADIDLVLDSNVEGIAEALTDRSMVISDQYDELIDSVGIGHEFDVVGIAGLRTQAWGTPLATGAADRDVQRAVMLRGFDDLRETLAAYHESRANADNPIITGNYFDQLTIATDRRAEELRAQADSGALAGTGDGSAAEAAAANHDIANEIADNAIVGWSFQLPTFEISDAEFDDIVIRRPSDAPSGEGPDHPLVILNGEYVMISGEALQDLAERFDYQAPDLRTDFAVDGIMNQYYNREAVRAQEKLASLNAELARLNGGPVIYGENLFADETARLEAEIDRLESERLRHLDGIELTDDALRVHLDRRSADQGFVRAAEAAEASTKQGPELVRYMFGDAVTVPLNGIHLDDDGNIYNFAVLRDSDGEIFNPVAGIGPSFADPGASQFVPIPGEVDAWRYASDEPLTFNHDFTPWTGGEEEPDFSISEIEVRRDANGNASMTYVVEGRFVYGNLISGQVGGVDGLAWNNVFAVSDAQEAQSEFFEELGLATDEATQPWRDRIASSRPEDRTPHAEHEIPLLDATHALDAAEAAYLADESEANRAALRDARYDWNEALYDYEYREVETAIERAQHALSNAPWAERHAAEQELNDLRAQLPKLNAEKGAAFALNALRDDDSDAARLELFVNDDGTVGTYSQSIFDRAAQESTPLTVTGDESARGIVAEHFFGDGELSLEQQSFVDKISDEITDIASDGEGQVETLPIMYEQEVDGEMRLVTDVIFRVTSGAGETRLVTVDGRSYSGEQDFRDRNKLVEAKGERLLIMPEEGQITYDDKGHVSLSIGDGRIESGFETFRRVTHLDTAVGVVGIGAGLALMLTPAGAPLGLVLLAGATAAYGAGTAGLDLHDRMAHGEDWNSSANLMNWGTIGASVLPAGSMLRAARIGTQYQAAVATARTATGAQTGIRHGTQGMRNSLTAFTGRNFTGSASDEFASMVGAARLDAHSGIVTTGLQQNLLVNWPGRLGGTLGTGLTAVDTVALAQHISEHGWKDTGMLNIGMTLTDIGTELTGAVSGLRFAGPGQDGGRPRGTDAEWTAAPEASATAPQPQVLEADQFSWPELPPELSHATPEVPPVNTGELAAAQPPELPTGPAAERGYTTLEEDFRNVPQYLEPYRTYLDQHAEAYTAWVEGGHSGEAPIPRGPQAYIAIRELFTNINRPHAELQDRHLDYVRNEMPSEYADLVVIEGLSVYPVGQDRRADPQNRPGFPDSAVFNPDDKSLHFIEFKTGAEGNKSALQQAIEADPEWATLSDAAAEKLNALFPEKNFHGGMQLINAFPGGVTWSQIREPGSPRKASAAHQAADTPVAPTERQTLRLDWNSDGSHRLVDVNNPSATELATAGAGGTNGPGGRTPDVTAFDDPDGPDEPNGRDRGDEAGEPDGFDGPVTANTAIELAAAALLLQSADWRTLIGDTETPTDLLVPKNHNDTLRMLIRYQTDSRLNLGTISADDRRAMLGAIADSPVLGELATKLRRIRDRYPERFDAVKEHLREGIEEAVDAAPEGANWFDPAPAGVDVADWGSLGEQDMAAFAFIAQAENAVRKEHDDRRGVVVEELDRFIKKAESNWPILGGRAINRFYADFRERNNTPGLADTLSAQLTGIRDRIANDEIRMDALEYVQDAALLLIGLRAKVGGTPINPAAAAALAAGAAVPGSQIDYLSLLESAPGTARDASSNVGRYNKHIEPYRNLISGAAYGNSAALKTYDALVALIDREYGAALYQGARGGLDGARAFTAYLDQVIRNLREAAVGPLTLGLEENKRKLEQVEPGSDNALALERDRVDIFTELTAHATANLLAQRKLTRAAPVGDLAGIPRVMELLTKVSEAGLPPKLEIGLQSAVGALASTYVLGTMRNLARHRGTINDMDIWRNRNLPQEIMNAGDFQDILNLIPWNADLSERATMWDGSTAWDVRTWISGDESAAHQIVKVYMRQNPPETSMHIEMHVIDLRADTYDILNREAALPASGRNPTRSITDPNYVVNAATIHNYAKMLQDFIVAGETVVRLKP